MHMTIAFNRAPSIEPSLLSLTEQPVHLHAAERQSTAKRRCRRQVSARGRTHSGSKIEDFGVARDCEHQNDASDDIVHGNNDLIEARRCQMKAGPISRSSGSDRLPAGNSGDD
jgi:hypothetical protein